MNYADKRAETLRVLLHILDVCESPIFLCVAGNYLMIHLKEAGESGTMDGGTNDRPSISSMNFIVEDQGASGISFMVRSDVYMIHDGVA